MILDNSILYLLKGVYQLCALVWKDLYAGPGHRSLEGNCTCSVRRALS